MSKQVPEADTPPEPVIEPERAPQASAFWNILALCIIAIACFMAYAEYLKDAN